MTGTTYEIQRDLPFKSKVVCHKVNDLLMANAAYENAPSIAPPRERTGFGDGCGASGYNPDSHGDTEGILQGGEIAHEQRCKENRQEQH